MCRHYHKKDPIVIERVYFLYCDTFISKPYILFIKSTHSAGIFGSLNWVFLIGLHIGDVTIGNINYH